MSHGSPAARRRLTPILALGLAAMAGAGTLGAQAAGANGAAPGRFDQAQFKDMRYRMVGPARGGRVTAVTGVPSEPHTFYMGATGGGVWKTTDAG